MKIYLFSNNCRRNNYNNKYHPSILGVNLKYTNNSHELKFSQISFCANIRQNKSYDKWFTTYLKYTDEKQSISDEIVNIAVNTDLYDTLLAKNNIKILDIGCGNGMLTEKYVNGLSKIFPDKKFKISAIDINKNLLHEFEETTSLPYNKNIELNIEEKDFFSESENNEKYDIVIASHVMYYTDNLSKSLIKIKNSLNDNGKAIIIHHSGNGCILSKLRAKYNPISPANLNQTENTIEKKDIIEETLNNLGIKHNTQKQFFNLLFPKDIYSKDGMYLISFLMDKSFLDLYKEGKINSIIRDIKEHQNKDGILNLHNNMYVMENSRLGGTQQ